MTHFICFFYDSISLLSSWLFPHYLEQNKVENIHFYYFF